MRFNVFKIFLFISCNLLYSVSYVQHKRFCDERKLYWHQLSMIKRATSPTEDDDDDEKIRFYDKKRVDIRSVVDYDEEEEERGDASEYKITIFSLVEDISWMLEYNQDRPFQLVIYILQLLILVFQIIKSLIFSSFPKDRDLSTGEFKHDVLKFLESTLHVGDMLYKVDRNGLLNQVTALLCFQFLILRLRTLYCRIKEAKINRFKYQRLNIVAMNTLYCGHLHGSWYNWWNLFKKSSVCHCIDHRLLLRGEHGHKMKELGFRIQNLDRIDKLYFFNQIDFTPCYKETGISCSFHDADYSIKTHTTVPRTKLSIPTLSKTGDILWLKIKLKIFHWVKGKLMFHDPERQVYTPKPIHRAQTFHSWSALFILLLGVNFTCFVVTITSFSLLYISLVEPIDENNGDITDELSLSESTLTFKEAFFVFQGITTVVVLGINSFEYNVLTLSNMILRSRILKVSEILKRETENYRNVHIKAFNRFLDKHKIDLIDFGTFSKESDSNDDDNSNSVTNKRLFEHRWSLIHPPEIQDFEFSSSRLTSFGHRTITFYDAVERFMKQVSREQLIEINTNISHTLDLVEVLQGELNDLRTYFTFYLNVTIVIGGLSFAVALTLLSNARTKIEQIITFSLAVCAINPMFVALSEGALIEAKVSIDRQER